MFALFAGLRPERTNTNTPPFRGVCSLFVFGVPIENERTDDERTRVPEQNRRTRTGGRT
jgi:hypothetical protein